MTLDLNQIRNDLQALNEWEVVLFGSNVREEARPTSDIDVAVVIRIRDQNLAESLLQSMLGVISPNYDLKIYEFLPLKIQKAIADEFLTIFGDPLEISEYFYSYRKLWDDCKHRIYGNMFHSYKEQVEAIAQRKHRQKT
ncbi:MAG TPA: nucleotidyltransferase domain-containing protein [Candidatus Lokiarchaeia archaeon]|nr:nucleotidyltransferase domain-containing protein [Candidatus Lokiarchaeia archaeon]